MIIIRKVPKQYVSHFYRSATHRNSTTIFKEASGIWYFFLSANWTFSLWCVLLIKSGSLNWPWSTKILGQFVTQIPVSVTSKHIMMSPIKTRTSVLSLSTDINTSITARPIIGLAEILVIMSVSTFKTDVILYLPLYRKDPFH